MKTATLPSPSRAFWLILVAITTVTVACGSDGNGSGSTGNQPASSQAAAQVDSAPEITGISNWYNTAPLTLAELRGSPVLVVFWSDT
ncbi:MAG: hypothetical protein M3439_09495 [Chloroflexota bacterium]|nr:hypothetical protein [Chloroflexota bacterium]